MSDGLADLMHKVLNVTLFTVAGTPVTVASLGTAFLILVGTWWLTRLVDRALARAPQLKILDAAAITGLRRLSRYSLFLIGAAVSLQSLGFDLSTLFTAGAIFAVGFGIAMQTIAQNFVSGMILLAERTVRQNDVIMVEGTVVRVVDTGLRATLARTWDDEEIVIPNSLLVQSPVKNYTLSDALYRLRSKVTVVYASDMRRVREVLEAVGEAIPFRSKRKKPRVLLLGFGEHGLAWEVSVWISDPWDQPRSLSRLNEAVWFALLEAGIQVAVPQLALPQLDPVGRSPGSLLEKWVGPRGEGEREGSSPSSESSDEGDPDLSSP